MSDICGIRREAERRCGFHIDLTSHIREDIRNRFPENESAKTL
jgi:hypothetical protein